jgi:hypothetical protein
VSISIPYLSPELIAAILGRESATVSDMRADPKPATDSSLPIKRFPSIVNEKSLPAPIQGNTSWSRQFAVLAKLIGFRRV